MCRLAAAGVLFLFAGRASALTGDEVRAATGVGEGLCVVVGCNDAVLASQLHNDGRMHVHGITTDKAALATVRQTLLGQFLYGTVTVEPVPSYASLPYADNLVDLLICDADALGAAAPSAGEISRVLCPDGVAYVKNDGTWAATVKGMPTAVDDWPQFFQNAACNPQNNDSLAGPVHGIQWYVPQATSTNCQLLTAGRILNGGVSAYFTSRSAFNGILRWRLAERSGVDMGATRGVKIVTSVCADEDRVYGVLTDTGKAQSVDIATGALTRFDQGVTIEAKKNGGQWVIPTSPIHVRYENLLVQAYARTVLALDPATGQKKWQWENPDQSEVSVFCVSAGDGKVFLAYSPYGSYYGVHYWNKCSPISSIAALSAGDGSLLWRNTAVAGDTIYTIMYNNNSLYLADLKHGHSLAYKEFTRIDAASGAIAATRTFTDKESPSWGGALRVKDGMLIPASGNRIKTYDLSTFADGSVLYDSTGFGHCATFRGSAFGQTAGNVGFIDFRTNLWEESYVTRNGCDQSLTPAYGMLYAWPSGCGCWPYFHGQIALRCSTMTTWSPFPDNQRLETAQSYTPPAAAAWPAAEEWPMIFQDPAHNNYGTTALGADFKLVFEASVPLSYAAGPVGWDQKENIDRGGPITAPVVAEDKLFVAAVDAHTLHAFDARTGAPEWTFTAGGRIDSPPTIYRGLCLFGGRDGYVYAVRASDGKLVWRFFAAPAQRNIVIAGQVESLWPVHGSVMVFMDKLYVAAGRHSDADGGIRLYKLDPFTGAVEAKGLIGPGRDWSHDATVYRGYGGFGKTQGRVCDVLVVNQRQDILFMHNIAIEPGTLNWADVSCVPAGNPLFPDAPGVTVTRSTPGLISYPHVSREGLTYQDDDTWMYCVSTEVRHLSASKEPRKLSMELPPMRKGTDLYTRIGGHLRATILHYTLDDNGEPVDPANPDTAVHYSVIKNFHTRYATGKRNGAILATGDHVAAAGFTEGSTSWNFMLLNLKTNEKILQEKIASGPVKYGIAAAYGRIYVSLNNGKVLAFGGGPVSVSGSRTVQHAAPAPSAGVSSRGEFVYARPAAATVRSLGAPGLAAVAATESAVRPSAEEGAIPRLLEGEPAHRLGVTQEVWAGVGAESLDDFIDYEYYPANPTARTVVPTFCATVTHMDNYGLRLAGYVEAPATGSYRFIAKAGSETEVTVTEENADPEGEPLALARSGDSDESVTEAVVLTKGHRYLVEVLMAQASEGADICEVLWTRPGTGREAIPTAWLSPLQE